jgi:hypothetical protein
MLRKLLVWPKGSMQTLTDKNLDWNLKGNFSRMKLLLKILDSILVSGYYPMFKTVSTNIAHKHHKEIPTSGASCSSKAD